MFKVILYLLFCTCLLFLVYTAFFKKGRVESRLEEIGKDPFHVADKVSAVQKLKRRNLPQFIKIPERVRADIAASGIPLRTEEFVMIWISIVFFPVLIFFALGQGIFITICLAFIMSLVPPIFVKIKRKKRLDLFGVQLGDALPLISNGLRAGFSFEQALVSVSKDMPNPIAQELTRATRELAMGVSLERVLNSLGERMENEDMQLLTSAVLIQRKVGGNLADILETISETIQGRIRLKNHINTLTAQGRYSGYLIGAVPVFLLFILSAVSPDYMSVLWTTTYGIALLCIAVVMEIAAFIIIKKMITLE